MLEPHVFSRAAALAFSRVSFTCLELLLALSLSKRGGSKLLVWMYFPQFVWSGFVQGDVGETGADGADGQNGTPGPDGENGVEGAKVTNTRSALVAVPICHEGFYGTFCITKRLSFCLEQTKPCLSLCGTHAIHHKCLTGSSTIILCSNARFYFSDLHRHLLPLFLLL